MNSYGDPRFTSRQANGSRSNRSMPRVNLTCRPRCTYRSPRTQTWQRPCPTARLYAPICAQRESKKGDQQEQCLGRSRGGFSSKTQLLVPALCFPPEFILTGAERHDISQAESLLAPFHFDAVIAEIGHDSGPLRDLLAALLVEVIIPSCRDRKRLRNDDRIPLPRTQQLRTFQLLNQVVSTHILSLC